MQSTVAPPTLACTVTPPRPSDTFSVDGEKGPLGDAVKLTAGDPAACVHDTTDGDLGRRKSSAGQEEKDERFAKTRVTHNTIIAQNSPGFANFVPVLLLLALGARQLPLRLNPLEVHRWT